MGSRDVKGEVKSANLQCSALQQNASVSKSWQGFDTFHKHGLDGMVNILIAAHYSDAERARFAYDYLRH